MPFANSVVASPGVGLAYQEICALLNAYQQQIFHLKASNAALRVKVAEYDSCGRFVTSSMREALPAVELNHALNALAATERGGGVYSVPHAGRPVVTLSTISIQRSRGAFYKLSRHVRHR